MFTNKYLTWHHTSCKLHSLISCLSSIDILISPLIWHSVEPPITKVNLLIIEHFPIFSLFLKQIEWFWCHWVCKLEGDKCSFNIRNKGATENAGRGWVIVCFNFCLFWVIKNMVDALTKVLQNLFVLQRQRCNDLRF